MSVQKRRLWLPSAQRVYCPHSLLVISVGVLLLSDKSFFSFTGVNRLKAADHLDLVAKCLDIKIKALKLLQLDVATATAANRSRHAGSQAEGTRACMTNKDRPARHEQLSNLASRN
ncbi:hypothetical protein DAI22_03g403600 [Oryza sativa Japonica Group]|nr:hypothetical protein DAI22_03g403600 [Oryza sativa Japonica Group]